MLFNTLFVYHTNVIVANLTWWSRDLQCQQHWLNYLKNQICVIHFLIPYPTPDIISSYYTNIFAAILIKKQTITSFEYFNEHPENKGQFDVTIICIHFMSQDMLIAPEIANISCFSWNTLFHTWLFTVQVSVPYAIRCTAQSSVCM